MNKYSFLHGDNSAYPTGDELTQGLTKREYFATHAPQEVPAWFEHQPAKRPKEPSRMPANVREDDKSSVASWLKDACFDLPDYLHDFQRQWEDYWKAELDWKVNNVSDRYFQWRTYYAERMIQQLNVPVPY